MFPLRDDNPTVGTSAVTFALIALNILAWIFIQGMGTEPSLSSSVCELGAIPGEILGSVRPGTQVPLGPGHSCVIGESGGIRPLFTHMFLHGGWFHILGNMWFLFVFGDNVEDAMGPFRFVAFYLLCGLAAVGAQMLSNPDSAVPMVGASGAIGGVMGAYARLYPRAPVHLLIIIIFYVDRIVVPAVFMLGYWFLIQILAGVPALGGEGGGVAFWAHAGGFGAGFLGVALFTNPARLAAHRELLRHHAATRA